MKGITAINIIIILVLGVMALVAVIGMFMGVWGPAKSGTSLEAATKATCAKVNPAFCDNAGVDGMPVFDYDADDDGILNEHDGSIGNRVDEDDNLWNLCVIGHGTCDDWTQNVCIRQCLVDICGCPNYFP